MFTKIGTITVGVSDQDKALDFYVNKLGVEKVVDQSMNETERWLEVAPPKAGTHIMLCLLLHTAAYWLRDTLQLRLVKIGGWVR